ncbi:MAG: hypothetical protein WA045_16665, partial [Nitrospira sp.]
MRVYRSVCTYIWSDDKFPFASDDCQLVWFHIFTNPLSSPLGLFRASLAGLAEDKNRNGSWTTKRYTNAFREALRHGFVKYDPQALLIAFPKYFALENTGNHPTSPNVIKAWGERFNDLPTSPLKDECYASLQALLDAKRLGKRDGIPDGVRDGMRETFTLAFAKPTPIPDSGILIPEPEPEPEPEVRVRAVSDDADLTTGLQEQEEEGGKPPSSPGGEDPSGPYSVADIIAQWNAIPKVKPVSLSRLTLGRGLHKRISTLRRNHPASWWAMLWGQVSIQETFLFSGDNKLQWVADLH